MVYCFAFGCNHQSLREHCKFFRFPLKDAVLLEQWKIASKRNDRAPNQYDRLCSCHFNDGKKENGLTMFTPGKNDCTEEKDEKGKETEESGEKVEEIVLKEVKREIKEEVEEKSQIALTPSTPSGHLIPSTPPPSTQSNNYATQRLAMRRKRLRVDFVYFNMQNSKLKRLAPNPNPPGKAKKIANAVKAKLHAHLARSSSVNQQPPPSTPTVPEPPPPKVRMTRDQINWLRMIDRIRCLAFREARDAGATFISVRWVANCLNRSPAFVKKHWRGQYQDCIPPTALNGSAMDDDVGEGDEEDDLEDQKRQDGEVETLQDDWDPILEEQEIMESLLKPNETESVENGGNPELSVEIEPNDELLPLPNNEELSPPRRGKITPKRRTDSALLERNERSEEEEQKMLKCGQCGRKFSTLVNLERHVRLHRVTVGPFACPQCGSVFAKRRGLVRHLRVHAGEPRYACETCGKGFAQLTNLEKHRRLHTGERAYACRLCDRKFMEQEHLTSHMLQHSGERPYSCDFCDKRFKMQCHLVSHLRSHVPPLLAGKNATVE